MKKLMSIVILCAIIFASTAMNTAFAGPRMVNLAMVTVANDQMYWYKLGLDFQKRLEKISNGKMKVEIFAGGQLGSERQTFEQMASGALAMAIQTGTPMSAADPKIDLFSLPYLLHGEDEEINLLMKGEIGKMFAECTDKLGLKTLALIKPGFRCVMTKKPVKSPADLKGKKIRVMEATVWLNAMKAFGAAGVPMSFTELYSALQQGIVDGADGMITTFASERYYEVTPCFNEIGYAVAPSGIFYSKRQFDKLSSDEQKWVSQAAKETGDASIAIHRKVIADNYALVKDKATIIRSSQIDMKAFQNAAKPVWAEVAKNIKSGNEMVARFEKAIDKFRNSSK